MYLAVAHAVLMAGAAIVRPLPRQPPYSVVPCAGSARKQARRPTPNERICAVVRSTHRGAGAPYRPDSPLCHFDSGMLIVSWLFLENGAQVAFHSDRSHGNSAPYYGLLDVETGRLIDKWDGELTEKAPAWAQWFQ